MSERLKPPGPVAVVPGLQRVFRSGAAALGALFLSVGCSVVAEPAHADVGGPPPAGALCSKVAELEEEASLPRCSSVAALAEEAASPPPRRIATRTHMALPGIGLEVEDGKVFDGVYDPATKTVHVGSYIDADSLYASDSLPGTSVSGFDVTVDLGDRLRTLEIVTGPWAASLEKQTEVLGWVSAFYQSIRQASEARGSKEIHYVVPEEGKPRKWMRRYHCADLVDVVKLFEEKTGMELHKAAMPQTPDGAFFVCLTKHARNFKLQANYGVKLSAFAEGAIARDFGGRPGRAVTLVSGEDETFGPGCKLTDEVVEALQASTLMSVEPTDDAAFCEPVGHFDTEACGAPLEQPKFPCFPGCLMGQLCYGMATNRIWYDGAERSAASVLCAPDAEDCQAAALSSSISKMPGAYAAAAEGVADTWSDEEQLALRSLLIFNQCAAWISSLSEAGFPEGCKYSSYWEKQIMGALPKATFDQFKPHLPVGFKTAGGEQEELGPEPPYTRLSSYKSQVCDGAAVLGESARTRCGEYVQDWGLGGSIGGKLLPLFRIGGELSLVVESRFKTLYVAGGYFGVRHRSGVIEISETDLQDSINFVRTLNGVPAE